MPMGKSAMEVYAGPFTLLPGAWELVAVAKHRGRPDRFLLYFDALVLLEVSLNDRTSRREVLCVCRAWPGISFLVGSAFAQTVAYQPLLLRAM
jgi:hypothetical protein